MWRCLCILLRGSALVIFFNDGEKITYQYFHMPSLISGKNAVFLQYVIKWRMQSVMCSDV